MTRITTLTSLVLLAGIIAFQAETSPMREHLKQELPQYGFSNVDVDSLTSTQVAHINHLLHSNKSSSQIRGNIGAILGDSLLRLFK